MILLTTEKAFRKKIEKWCMYKDFLIVNAMERHGDMMSEYGNKIDADEFNPTPVLVKIATDPDSKEAKIKRQHLQSYLDRWLNDEGFQSKLHYVIGCILKQYATTGEDLNVFIVMRNQIFHAYHTIVERQINEDYGVECASFITHKLDKGEQRSRLEREFDPSYFKKMSKAHKQLKKALHIDDKRMLLDDDDIPSFIGD